MIFCLPGANTERLSVSAAARINSTSSRGSRSLGRDTLNEPWVRVDDVRGLLEDRLDNHHRERNEVERQLDPGRGAEYGLRRELEVGLNFVHGADEAIVGAKESVANPLSSTRDVQRAFA